VAKLTAKTRNALPKSEFALEKQRKYPLDTKNRAINAKGRAQQQYDEGRMSKSTLSKIDSKANKVLKGKK
jgi:hypothetical protein